MLNNIFQRYGEAVVRHRIAVVVVMLLLSGFLASRITTLRLDNDPDLWVPQNNEFIKTTHELERVFGGRNFTLIGVMPKHGTIYQSSVLRKIRAIQNGIEALPEAVKSNVVSLAAKRVKDIKGSKDGMVVRRMLDTIPQTPAEMERLRREVAANPFYINALVSPDGKAAAVIADFRLPKGAAYAPLLRKIKAVVDKVQDNTVDIRLGGQPVENATFEHAMAKMPLYFGIAFLIIMVVQYLAFRSIQGMLLPMVTAIFGVVWGLGEMALLGIPMDALNTTTPILIMAVGTGHSVQILKRYYEELERLSSAPGAASLQELGHQAVALSLGRVGPVMLTAGLIAALAFFSLTVSDVAIIRHFGTFAGLGILSVLLIELSFIPALRAMLPTKVRRNPDGATSPLHRLMGRIGRSLGSGSVATAVLVGAALLLAVALVGALRLHADNSLKQYSAPDTQVRQDDAVLNREFGGTDSISFLVDSNRPDGIKDPKVLQAMDKLQTFLDAQPYVGKTQSLADLIKRMNQAMHQDQRAFDKVPDSRNLIAQYLLLYSMSGDPQDFDNMVDNNYRKAVIWVYLKTDSTRYAEALYQRANQVIAKAFPPGVSVRMGGGLPQTMAINRSLTDTKFENIAQMALVVFVLSSLVLGSMVGGLLVVLPLAAIVLANLGIMGWLGIPLDMGTATTTAMVTGIGADYEIYMLYRLREEYRRSGNLGLALESSLLTSGKAVLFVALSIAGGYSALLVSDFGFYTRLSLTMMTTMLVSALLSLVFLRAVIAVFKPRFITRGDRMPVPVAPPELAVEEK